MNKLKFAMIFAAGAALALLPLNVAAQEAVQPADLSARAEAILNATFPADGPGAAVSATQMPSPTADRSAQQATVSFLEAFNALDPVRFDRFFAEDVSMFFPAGPFPKARVEGKSAVTAAFHRFFEMARERGATRLGIQPLDLQVQEYGEFAVASFHLRGNGNVGRRSLVMRNIDGEWRIVHFHASALKEAQ